MKEKSLALNALFNSLHRIVNLIFPIVTSIYISHILLADGIGKISIAQNLVQYFVILAPLGIPNYGTREIAKQRDNYYEKNKLFTELLLINFVSTCICIFFYYFSIFYMSHFSEERLLYAVCGIPIICNLFNIEWFFQGQEEYVYISIRNTIVKMLSLIIILFFVRKKSDYVLYALIYAVGLGANHILNLIRIRKFNVKLVLSDLSLKRHFRPIFILLCSAIAIELYTLLDTTMLGIMTSSNVVGYYTNSIKLNKIVVGLVAAIGGVLLPRLSYYRKNNMQEKCSEVISLITNIMLFLVIPAATGLFCLADIIVPLFFGNSFIPAIITTKIGTIIVIVLGLSNLFGTQVLLTYNKEKSLFGAVIIGALSNMCMNIFLIPKFQHNGAIVASVISETLVTVITFIMASRCVPIKIDYNSCIKSIFTSSIMFLLIIIIKQNFLNNKFILFFSVITGMISYFGLNLIFQNKIMKKINYKFLSSKNHN